MALTIKIRARILLNEFAQEGDEVATLELKLENKLGTAELLWAVKGNFATNLVRTYLFQVYVAYLAQHR